MVEYLFIRYLSLCGKEYSVKVLSSNELKGVAGGMSVWAGIAIAAAVVFLAGVIQGLVDPGRCSD